MVNPLTVALVVSLIYLSILVGRIQRQLDDLENKLNRGFKPNKEK